MLLVAALVVPAAVFAVRAPSGAPSRAPAPPPEPAWGDLSEPPAVPPVRERPETSVALALLAEGDAPGDDSPNVPRPAEATRLFHADLDETTTLTVFSVPGDPDDVAARFARSLEDRGFVPRRDAPKGTRVLARGHIEALVTASPGQAGTVLSVLESHRSVSR